MLLGQTTEERKAFEAGYKAAQAEKEACEEKKVKQNQTPYKDETRKNFESLSDEIVGETFDKDVETLNCAKV